MLKKSKWVVRCFVIICALTMQKGNAQEVKVGWEEWPPYQYQDDDGQFVGIDLEVISSVVASVGLSFEFKEMSWSRLLEEAKSGGMDVATGASKTAEREEWAYFSEPYRAESVVLFVKRGESEKFNISQMSDFVVAEMQVGGVIGYYYGEKYDALIKTDEFKSHMQLVRDGSLNYEKLKRGRIDALLQDPFVGKDQIESLGYVGEFEVHPVGPLYEDDIYFLLSKKLPKETVDLLNSGLQAIKDNGVHAEILKKYSDLN